MFHYAQCRVNQIGDIQTRKTNNFKIFRNTNCELLGDSYTRNSKTFYRGKYGIGFLLFDQVGDIFHILISIIDRIQNKSWSDRNPHFLQRLFVAILTHLTDGDIRINREVSDPFTGIIDQVFGCQVS
ncbi:hypothetical protein D3C72_1956500 [compost metagenome]